MQELASNEAVNPGFRLWLSSMPSPVFPLSVLHAGLKLAVQPPCGVRATLARTYAVMTDEAFEASPSRQPGSMEDAAAWHQLLPCCGPGDTGFLRHLQSTCMPRMAFACYFMRTGRQKVGSLQAAWAEQTHTSCTCSTTGAPQVWCAGMELCPRFQHHRFRSGHDDGAHTAARQPCCHSLGRVATGEHAPSVLQLLDISFRCREPAVQRSALHVAVSNMLWAFSIHAH